jgi:uncharacterized membrane-anchored protein YhcB (DUF1043 family)
MISKYLEQTNNSEIRNWINTTLAKRLKKLPEDQSEIEHILDYLASDLAPKRLQKMSYEQARIATQKWQSLLSKKGAELEDGPEDVKVIKRYKSGLRLVQLVSQDSYKREGTLMGHCVASYYGSRSCKVYSLRDFDNKPHATIEVEANERGIQQIKGKGNGSIHPRYVRTILAVLKHFKVPVRDSEMKNLGYTKLDKEEKEFVVKHFGESAKFYKDFFYNYSNLKERA